MAKVKLLLFLGLHFFISKNSVNICHATVGDFGIEVSSSIKRSPEDSMSFIPDIFHNLEQSIQFYNENYKRVNLDSLAGLRMAEGALYRILKRSTESKIRNRKGRKFLPRIGRFYKSIHSICEKSIPYIKRRRSEYLKNFLFLVKDKFTFYRKSRTRYRPSLVWKEPSPNKYSEKMIDKYFVDMAGGGSSGRKCTISQGCKEYLATRRTSAYGLTHQILVMVIAEIQGCKRKLAQAIGSPDLQSKYEELGSNMLSEMVEAADSGFPFGLCDIFLEQAAIGAFINLQEVFRLSWLRKMLSWQNKEGCIPWTDPLEDSRKRRKRQSNPEDLEKNEDIAVAGCSAHATGLSVAVYSLYLEWILFPPKQKNRDPIADIVY